MKFTVLGLKLSEIRQKVEQFLEDTQYEGRRVMIMTGPDDEGKCHPIPC
jgi:DNA-nicking Smr family endonuclease